MDVRIYYEDTDAGGVVYHSRYINFLERARTEFLRQHGQSVAALHDQGVIFPVVGIDVKFRSPARLDDLLEVTTRIAQVKNRSFVAHQQVKRKADDKLLVDAHVALACVGEGMKARSIPQELRELLVSLLV